MTEKEKNLKYLLYILVSFAVVLHLLTLHFPSVNQEFAFASAAQYFQTGDRRLLDIYFSYQANTLGVPLFAFMVHKLFPFVELAVAPRLSAILVVPLLGYACWVVARRLGIEETSAGLVVLLILTNPLVWIYSQRGTADFLPVAIGLLALAVLVGKRDFLGNLTAAIILGVASILKPHAAIFLVISVIWLAMEDTVPWEKRVITIMWFVSLALVLPVAYLLYVHNQFGFWLVPPRFTVVHQFTSGDWGQNFLAYVTYVVLLVLPFSAFVLYGAVSEIPARRRLLAWFGILLLAAMGILVPGAGGEMNFGPLDRYLEPKVLALLAGLGATTFGVMVYQFLRVLWRSEGSMLAFAAAAGLIIVMVVLSFSRPAQRYLLFVLPVLYLLMFALRGNAIPRWVLAVTFIGHMILCGYATAYQWVVGKAALDMAEKIEAASLLSITAPGPIVHHVGDRFFDNDPAAERFAVILGRHENALIVTEVSVLNVVRRTYSLVRLPDT